MQRERRTGGWTGCGMMLAGDGWATWAACHARNSACWAAVRSSASVCTALMAVYLTRDGWVALPFLTLRLGGSKGPPRRWGGFGGRGGGQDRSVMEEVGSTSMYSTAKTKEV